ncbi:MAG: hypothetical protein WCJ81_02330 [bacterium]
MAKTKFNKTAYLNVEKLVQGICTPKGSPASFIPESQEEATQWIDADRIFKIWRIAYYWGVFIPALSPAVILYADDFIGIYVTPMGMTVQILGKKAVFHEIKLRNGLLLQWDKEISLLLVEEWVANTYVAAQTKGLKNGGQLVMIPSSIMMEVVE